MSSTPRNTSHERDSNHRQVNGPTSIAGPSNTINEPEEISRHLVDNDERLFPPADETLVFVAVHKDGADIGGLYSMRRRTWKELPSIPNLPRGFPEFSSFVSLNRKIYVLGGLTEVDADYSGSTQVYVLDLAGQVTQWEECARMQRPRLCFGAGAIDGKIYVFGGTSRQRPVREAEVFDTTTNSWSFISSPASSRVNQQVSNKGGELVVHGGQFFVSGPDGFQFPDPHGSDESSEDEAAEHWGTESESDSDSDYEQPLFSKKQCLFLEVYNPVADAWRLMDRSFRRKKRSSLFVAREQLHMLTKLGACVHDVNTQSWRLLQEHTFAEFETRHAVVLIPYPCTVVVDEELLAIMDWDDFEFESLVLLRSDGFGNNNEKIVWESVWDTASDHTSGDLRGSPVTTIFMCAIDNL
ncbi:unnamed protein product [Calypogeia fissa]